MSRPLPSQLVTAINQREVQPYYAVEFLFDDSDETRWDEAGYVGNRALRFWTGYGDRTINSTTFSGAGNLISIGGLEETNDLSAKSASLSMSGIPQSLVTIALAEPYQRRGCRIYFGTVDTPTPIEVFSGLMNTMKIEDGGESSIIRLSVESKLVRLEKASSWRYTQANHQSRHTGDTFFNYVADLQDREIVWGREKA